MVNLTAVQSPAGAMDIQGKKTQPAGSDALRLEKHSAVLPGYRQLELHTTALAVALVLRLVEVNMSDVHSLFTGATSHMATRWLMPTSP